MRSKPKTKENNLLFKYGITHADYAKKFKEQAGLCAICKNPETAVIRGNTLSLAVDHDHATGKVRDLLCKRCNLTLGLVDENPDLFLEFFRYLIKHG